MAHIVPGTWHGFGVFSLVGNMQHFCRRGGIPRGVPKIRVRSTYQ